MSSEGGLAKGPVDLSPARAPQGRAPKRDARPSISEVTLGSSGFVGSVFSPAARPLKSRGATLPLATARALGICLPAPAGKQMALTTGGSRLV